MAQVIEQRANQRLTCCTAIDQAPASSGVWNATKKASPSVQTS